MWKPWRMVLVREPKTIPVRWRTADIFVEMTWKSQAMSLITTYILANQSWRVSSIPVLADFITLVWRQPSRKNWLKSLRGKAFGENRKLMMMGANLTLTESYTDPVTSPIQFTIWIKKILIEEEIMWFRLQLHLPLSKLLELTSTPDVRFWSATPTDQRNKFVKSLCWRFKL
jgi:hypothetical protein